MSLEGHGPAFQLTEASGRCRLGQATFAGRMPTGESRRNRWIKASAGAVGTLSLDGQRATRFRPFGETLTEPRNRPVRIIGLAVVASDMPGC